MPRFTPDRRRTLRAALLTACVACGVLAALTAAARYARAQQTPPDTSPTRFQKDIDAFLTADKTAPPPQKGVLFVGSSIFRLWTRLPQHMAPLPVFNRAFGGSMTTDVLYYMDRIVLPYEPRVIVYYCGSNDINAGRNADAIFDGFRTFVGRVHEKLPETRIVYVSINRAPQKRDRWDVVDEANRRAKEFCAKTPGLTFVDVNPALFDAKGRPRLELYLPDRLHFQEPAYDAFAAILKPVVADVWAKAGG
jgi:lysophospholipase L1-like esterase